MGITRKPAKKTPYCLPHFAIFATERPCETGILLYTQATITVREGGQLFSLAATSVARAYRGTGTLSSASWITCTPDAPP